MAFKKINSRRTLKVIDGLPCPIKVGDHVFLAGETVIAKYECKEKTPSGFRFVEIFTGKTFVYKTPTPYFTSGKPLFKNGLPCYPEGHEGMEMRYITGLISERCRESISELIKTHRELSRKSEVEIFFINVVVQMAVDTLKELNFKRIDYEQEAWYLDALRRIFNVWRKSWADFGGLVNAMDGAGLFAENLFELNVERAKRRGVSNFRLHSIRRDAKIGVEKALSRPGKG
jgi:hypothetical protein